MRKKIIKEKLNVFEELMNDKDFTVFMELTRWNGKLRIKTETLAHHTFLVIWFSRMLAEFLCDKDELGEKLTIIDYATYHDATEMFDFDISHEIKYQQYNGKEIKKLIESYTTKRTIEKYKEQNVINNMFKNYFISKEIPERIKLIVKISDWLACIYYLNKEIQLGNKSMREKYWLCVTKMKEVLKELIGKYEEVYDTTILQEMLKSKFTIQ